jgi:hypothetical protein
MKKTVKKLVVAATAASFLLLGAVAPADAAPRTQKTVWCC